MTILDIKNFVNSQVAEDTFRIYERALDATSYGVTITDAFLPELPIVYCNPAFEKITGYSKAEVLGRNYRFLQGADTDPLALNYLGSYILSGRECQIILKNYRKNGEMFWNEVTFSPLRDQNGIVTHFIGIQFDVTSRVLSEESIHQQVEREKLINTISSRIRQSLNLEDILNTTVLEIRQFLKTDRVGIYKFAPDMSGTIVSESVLPGWTTSLNVDIQDTCFQFGGGVSYAQGRKRAINDIYNAGLTECHIKLLEQFEVKANLVVPIIISNQQIDSSLTDEYQSAQHKDSHQGQKSSKLWGLLVAHHCSSTRYWQESELTLLDQLGGQIAIAIYQSELYQRVQTELQERKQVEIALRTSEAKTREQAQQLGKALKELKQTQAQLVQNEKMSSLGQLVAGIAHEINNPISFIHGNINYAQEYVEQILRLLDLYQLHYPQPEAEIRTELENLDLDFLVNDLTKVLSSMSVGTERIRQIVLSLRNFSRLDEAEFKFVDIHEGIDNTLLILQHRLRGVGKFPAIKVVTDYAELPFVECYPSQLNQVFMNLLSNAIDALEDTEKPGQEFVPTILIKTKLTTEGTLLIQIVDNGKGIPEEVRSRIFDPFFTTKPIGKGTGLGLSICYQIVVEKHGGKIACYSQTGEGTTFTVEVPLQHNR